MAGSSRAQPIWLARSNFAEQMRRGDSYGLLLGLILLTYAVMALVDHEALWSRFVVSAMLGTVLLLALHTSHVRERAFRVCAVIVGVAALSTLLQAIFDRRTNDGTTFIMFFLVIAAPIVILNRILRHRVIGRETILGAVCVYVLLGIVFAGIYAAINDIDGGQFFAQRVVQSNVDFLYFSFVVLTTLGFGDLTPKPDIARVIVTFEALIGQVFLVTLVARLMALYGLERRQSSPVAPEAGTAEESDLEE
jgi:Ion channel